MAPCAENRFEPGSHAIRVNCAYYDLHEHANCRVNYLRRVTPSGLQFSYVVTSPKRSSLDDPKAGRSRLSSAQSLRCFRQSSSLFICCFMPVGPVRSAPSGMKW